MSVEGPGGSSGQRFTNRNGPKPLSFVVLSVLGSSVAVTAVGCVCAFIYPILKGNRACVVRVCVSRAHDVVGTAPFYFEVIGFP